MKISIIIPAYNEEQYLSKTLENVLAQDYNDFEVIVVDNASTDRTAEIARSFPKVKVFFEGNKGTMWACERGRKEATGEIIVRMDADCLPEKDWLAKGAAHFSDQKVVAVTGPYDYYDASFFFRYSSLLFQKYIFFFTSSLTQFLKRGAVMVGGNSFMRAESIAAAGGFDTKFIFYGDDTDTAKRLTRFGKVVFDRNIVMPTSARRFKREGLIRTQLKYFFNFLKVICSSRMDQK